MEKKKLLNGVLCLFLASLLMAGCGDDDDDDGITQEDPNTSVPTSDLMIQSQAEFGALPQSMPGASTDTTAEIDLGRDLYFEKALSVNQTQSCNTCHPIDGFNSGANHTETSEGALGEFGPRNAPTVLNAGFHVDQFWDGRADDLKEQAKGPPLNPIEMAMPSAEAIEERLRDMEGYQEKFQVAYPLQQEPVTFDNMAAAIAAFERTLLSQSHFDRYLAGDEEALTEAQKEGLQSFIDIGCVQCHHGSLLGGITYQRLGIFGTYERNLEDLGLEEVTGDPNDRYVFKVPTLRESVLTAPYFHDGRVATLGEAVDLMASLQLGKQLTVAEIHPLLRFIATLSNRERTSAPPPPEAEESQPAWSPRTPADLPPGSDAEYGYRLLSQTYNYLGGDAVASELEKSGNILSCTNCHQEAGTKRFGLTWVGVTDRYPTYRARSNKIASLEDRINGCFQRSMNGEPLAVDSPEMQAMVAYMQWLSEDAPPEVLGVGSPTIDNPNRAADLASAAGVYDVYCMGCHGKDGAGYTTLNGYTQINPDDAMVVAPPLWGPETFNIGAGMHRLLTSSAFLRANMPLGIPWNEPALTDEQAYDVGAYFNNFERPLMENLEQDWAHDLTQKPVDCPYPPYADDFPQEQHQFGPFQPIKDFYASP